MRLKLGIGPTDEWIPGFLPDPPPRLQRSWRVDVIKAMRYLRKRAGGEAVETPQSWWTAHLEAALINEHKYSDEHGLPRLKVPPDLRAAFDLGDIKGCDIDVNEDWATTSTRIKGNAVNEQGRRAKLRSVLLRSSCRVAPTDTATTTATATATVGRFTCTRTTTATADGFTTTSITTEATATATTTASPGTTTPPPSAVSEAKHSTPLREGIDACCASLLKLSPRKKAWQVKQHAAAVAHVNDGFLRMWLEKFRYDVAVYWVLREDARRRQEVARAAAASNARAAAKAGGGEGGSGGPAGAFKASDAVEVLNEYKCPITAEIMTDPVCTADGFTYERTAIAEWLRTNDTSPSTGAKLACKRLVPNITVRCLLQHL